MQSWRRWGSVGEGSTRVTGTRVNSCERIKAPQPSAMSRVGAEQPTFTQHLQDPISEAKNSNSLKEKSSGGPGVGEDERLGPIVLMEKPWGGGKGGEVRAHMWGPGEHGGAAWKQRPPQYQPPQRSRLLRTVGRGHLERWCSQRSLLERQNFSSAPRTI